MTNADALLHEAQELQQAGKIVAAECLYRRALEQVPDCGEIHFLLGCLCVRAGRPADGLPALTEAARLLPHLAEPQIVLGNVLISLGRWSEAAEVLVRAVQLRPDLIPVKANLAVALCSAGRAAESEALYREILKIDPDSQEAHGNLAHVLNEQKRFDEATQHARRAVDLAPNNPSALNILGISLYGLGRPEEAETVCLRALALDPNLLQPHLNLYNIYRDQMRHEEAEQAARHALAISPDCAPAIDALGMALTELDRFDEAIACFRRLMRLQPDSAVCVLHLAVAYRRKGLLEEAVAYGLKAVELDTTPEARHSVAQDQIRTGRYREGWANLLGEAVALDGSAPEPKWDGTPLEGRTLLVYAVAGQGDTIQFARYIPLVLERARGRVLFECQPSLMELLGDIPGIAQIVPRTGDRLRADCYISLLSLPGLFGTTEETIPSPLLPIRVPEEAEAFWRRRLDGMSGLKVGLGWAGDPNYVEDRTRSMHLEMFAPLAAVKGLNLISLQLGPRSEEVRSGNHGLEILHVPEELAPFGKTAALLRELDLVISSCTSVPHLAGTLGIETWLLLPYVPPPWWNAYRRNDTPWYPRHRLFFQPRHGDWGSVVARVCEELASRTGSD